MSDKDPTGVEIVVFVGVIPNLNPEPNGQLLDASNRQSFLLKLFGILTQQLVLLIVLTSALVFVTQQLRWIPVYPEIFPILSLVLFPVALISLSCCFKTLKREKPGNKILFLVFTLIEGTAATTAVFGSTTYDLPVFAGVILMTLLSFILFTCQNTFKFTKWAGIFLVVLIGCTVFSLSFKFLEEPQVREIILLPGCFALFICGIMVWEIQHVVRIGGKHELTPHDLIYAALVIHLAVFAVSFMVLFIPVYCFLIMEAVAPHLHHEYCMPIFEEGQGAGTGYVRRGKIAKILDHLQFHVCRNQREN